jgi:hypothetical protein
MARPGDEKAYLTNQYGSGSSQVTAAGRYSDDFHTYTIEWAPSAFRILVDGVPRMTDSHTFQVDYLRVYAYDRAADPIGGTAPAGPPRAAGPPATAASAVGHFLVLMSGAGAAVAVVAAMIVGYARLRARRRLRPAHRA